MMHTRDSLRASVVASVTLFCSTAFATPEITNWYHVEIWRFPDPPQNPSDADSLPVGRDNIQYNQSVHTNASAQAIDMTFGGDTPRSGAAGTSRHVARVVADSSYTHLRAAFETSVTNFLASNLRPGYYRDEEGNVQVDYGDFGSQTLVATYVDELFTLTGPEADPANLTYVLNLSGSNTSNIAASGAGSTHVEPWTGGIIAAYGAKLFGQFIELPMNQSVSGSRSLTVQLNSNAPTHARLAMSLQNYLLGYLPNLTDDVASATYLNGVFNWNYETTATIEKLIVELPRGANPLDYTFTAASGANYNVEFRVIAVVPEPSTLALLMFAACTATHRRARKKIPLAY